MRAEAPPAVPATAAIYIAALQFLFAITWTNYVIFLPRLLQAAGLPPAWAPWVLVLDQLVFMVADVATGVYADRVQSALGRLGPLVVGTTAVSALAFLLLPHVVLLGSAAPLLALGLVAVWAVTSSALRAPVWMLLGKHAARPALPWLNALALTGLAVAGAAAPFLGVALKNLDPRMPFALCSAALLAATAGIVPLERRLGQAPTPAALDRPRVLDGPHAAWMLGILLLAAAFQTHFSLNSAAQYLRFARPADLEWLMPLFWVGFGLGTLPAAALCKRLGALPLVATAAACAAAAAAGAAQAGSLTVLMVAQCVAGAAWGAMTVAIFSSATELGRSGREGLMLGTLFAMLALATIVRIGVTLAGVPGSAAAAPVLSWLPVLLWALGGAMIGLLALRAPVAGKVRAQASA